MLRRSWSLKGKQAQVKISGRNGRQILSCALNPKTGKRIILQHKGMNSAGFQALLQKVRNVYSGRPVYLLGDKGSLYRAKASIKKAEALNIELI